jgi:hypothetical protein
MLVLLEKLSNEMRAGWEEIESCCGIFDEVPVKF